MPTVSCPSCSTRQTVDPEATSYSCSSCSATWRFVTCRTCGSRFHARPDGGDWRCPNCGTPNDAPATVEGAKGSGGTAAEPAPVSVKGDDLDSVPEEPMGGPQSPFGAPEPGSAFPMPQAEGRHVIPTWAMTAAAALVAGLIVLFLLTRGDDGGTEPGGSAAADPTAELCRDVQQLQVLRTDALDRAQQELKADADALKEAGDKQAAKQVRALVAAVGEVRTALENQKNSDDEVAAMLKAVNGLPC